MFTWPRPARRVTTDGLLSMSTIRPPWGVSELVRRSGRRRTANWVVAPKLSTTPRTFPGWQKKWIIRIYFKRIITCSEGQTLSPSHLELPSSSLHLLHRHVLALRHHLHLQQKPRLLKFEITDQGNIEKVCKYVKGDSNVDEINTSKVSLRVLSSCPLVFNHHIKLSLSRCILFQADLAINKKFF